MRAPTPRGRVPRGWRFREDCSDSATRSVAHTPRVPKRVRRQEIDRQGPLWAPARTGTHSRKGILFTAPASRTLSGDPERQPRADRPFTSVLITDGNERAALALARGLGRVGYRVQVVSRQGSSIAGQSRYVRGEARAADPLVDPKGFVRDVAAARDRFRADVIIPVSDASVLAILGDRRALGDVTIPFADLDTFRAISDKSGLIERASRLGIAVPGGHTGSTRAEVRDAAHALGFPVVLKPSRSVAIHGERRIKLGVSYAANPRELDARLDALDAAAYPLIVQRRVTGAGLGVFVLLWDGEVRATFAHRRVREKPPSGGVSVCCESIPLDRGLLEQSIALLRDAGWRGVAMVEYKNDDRHATPVLMEVNGRFWGSLQLASDAGVNFPALLVGAALGAPVLPPPSYAVGVRNHWFWGEVDHLLTRVRRSPATLDLPPDAPGRLAVVSSFLRAMPASLASASTLDDPRPFLRESRAWFRRS